jgi:hypothetical protein
MFLGLLFLCSCATTPHPVAIIPASELPAAVTMNPDAGCGTWLNHGGLLIVKLRIGSGKQLPFVVDTGSPVTIFDKSLEPRLGKQLGTNTFLNFGAKRESGIYASPEIYFNNIPLMTSSNIYTVNFKSMDLDRKKDHSIMGILGMDCLRHYCIQLDFDAGKMRFLDPDHLNTNHLGKAFKLMFSSAGQSDKGLSCPYIRCGSPIGGKGGSLAIDTGCNIDGGMPPRFFWQEVKKQKVRAKKSLFNGQNSEEAIFPKCVWCGETYTNLDIRTWPAKFQWSNLIGLSFLARHLVTLDFPKRVMYLKQTSVGPIVERGFKKAMNAAVKSAVKVLERLNKRGKLPGYSKDSEGTTFNATYTKSHIESITLDCRKKGDSSSYHYTFTRASKDSPWKLQKAWRTDQNDKMIEEYPVH